MMMGEGVFGETVSGNRIFLTGLASIDVPDRQNTTGLGETSLLLNTTDALLQDGGDLGGLSLGLSGVGTDLLGGTGEGAGDSRADLQWAKKLVSDELIWRMFDQSILNGATKGRMGIREPIELIFRDGTCRIGDGRGWPGWDELTEATRPVA